ncbi:MAG: hypothetical protein CHACPFDD_03033 [Phycisphaerae bacterium]|nr:hypothetical protein [Phycisphaerae bacterium]
MILLYHRVADLPSDPQLLAVSPERFAQHLSILRRRANPISLAEMLQKIGQRRRIDGDVAITFDDGYADNLLHALPILKRYDIPATFFIVSGAVGGGAEFWWDEVERLILSPHDATDPRWNVCDTAPRTPRQQLYVSLCERIRPLDPPRRAAALAMLRAWTRQPAAARPTHRALSRGELRKLASSRHVAIGAHTVTHPVLAQLAPAAQYHEIVSGRLQLERIIGRPVSLFSYPYGTRDAFDRTSVACLRQTGFAAACANRPGPVSRASNRFALPRFVVRDWDAQQFERQWRRWRHTRSRA